MNHRLTYLIAGVAGLSLLIVGVSTLSAQRPPLPLQPPPFGGFVGVGPGPQTGRFTVAFGSATKVLILDTTTGKVYHAKEADFLDIASLPKAPEPPQPPRRDERGKDRPGRNEERKERDERPK